ncbi:MAG: membrane dipeptidase [Myxococcales bacterium]|nr:membrane dipeptidase [Myxococcales bacterium]
MLLARDAGVVDLHLDTFIPHRLFGWDWTERHAGGPVGRRFFGHVDWPRARDGGLVGGGWSITTNPFRRASRRWTVFLDNVRRVRALIEATNGGLRLVTNATEWRAARADGVHAATLAIQGGNAVDAAPDGVRSIPGDVVTRITLVHLTNSSLGATNSPLEKVRGDKHLTPWGRTVVEQCNERRVFVDLAHIHERGFWDAVDVHDRTQPLIATHAGAMGVRESWRNLTDDQIRTIADTGGVVGIIFEPSFLRRPGGPEDGASMVVEHLERVIEAGGEEAAALGSDFDGAIRPTRDLRGADHYPVVVQRMLDRGWSEDRVRRVLSGNFEASFARLRP